MQNAAKNKSLSLAGLMALRVLLLLVVALCLGQTRVWGFAVTPQPASGVFESVTPSSIGENYDGWQYDASDSLLAAKVEATVIYRGVPAGTQRFEQAIQGVVKPRGTALDPMSLRAHVLGGDVSAGVTSWTTNKAVAATFAGREGIILQIPLNKVSDRIITRPFVEGKYGHESEILLKGIVNLNGL